MTDNTENKSDDSIYTNRNGLEDQEERYRAYIRQSPEGVFVADSQGNYVEVNEAACKITGFTAKELTSISITQLVAPEAKEDGITHFKKLKETGEANGVILCAKKDGTRIFLHIDAVAINENCFVGFCRDVTQEKEDEEKEKKFQQKLIQADKMISLGHLVSGLTREISKPTNSIMFNVPMLKEIFDDLIPLVKKEYKARDTEHTGVGGIPHYELEEAVSHLLDSITSSAEQIQTVVKDLRTFSEPNLMGMDQQININDVVESSLNLLSNMVQEASHSFTVNYGKKIPWVHGNYQRLKQVMLNLIRNALLALESNEQAVTVTTFYDSVKQEVVVMVEDEGIGLSDEERKFVLDPFYTTRRNRGGIGLGLAVSERIIDDHGGYIDIQSSPSGGSRFSVNLPLPPNVE